MNETQFKYPDWRLGLENCPPQEYREIETAAYRFVHEDLRHPNNFVPVQIIKPQHQFQTSDARCKALGLSFFSELGAARRFFHRQMKHNPRYGKVVGNRVASLQIAPDDGVASEPEPENFGHFTFHEYLWTDFSQKIRSIEPF